MTRSNYKPISPPRLMTGKPVLPAKCIGCGRDGKSQTPDFYLCTVCYHERHAAACEDKVERLKKRIEKIEREGAYHRSMADEYSRRWHGKPSKVKGDRQEIPPGGKPVDPTR